MNLDSLNKEQKKAVTCGLGPVIVIAGAGTGKTHVLTSRYIYLMQEYQLLPQRILAITFTNKAAKEMYIRIKNATNAKNINYICTFHALALRILREDIDYLNRNNNFNVIDEEDVENLIKEIYKELDIKPKDLPIRHMNHLIEIWKNQLLDEEDANDVLNSGVYYGFNTVGALKTAYSVYISYLRKQEHLNLIDFNDLIILSNRLLSEFPEVQKKWSERFDYILVDEFQDINDSQLSILQALMNNNQDIFMVGDPDQTIYTWRGANDHILFDFMKKYTQTQLIILERNYRSTQNILSASNLVISENVHRYKKNLFTENYEGEKIIYYNAADENAEAQWVVKKIEKLLRDKTNSPNQICVLYRSKYSSRSLEQVLIERNIKYKIIGAYKFYQRKEIKDMIAYFKVINNHDELSLKRIANTPRRKISTETVAKLNLYAYEHKLNLFDAFLQVDKIAELTAQAKLAVRNFVNLILQFEEYAKTHTLTELFDEVYIKSGYNLYIRDNLDADKSEYVTEFKQAVSYYEDEHKNENVTLNQYLQDIALFTSLEEEGKVDDKAILLMTVHQAKGLEFDHVFIFNFTDEAFPSAKSKEENNIEEERRIAYVAMTRAKKQLFISMNNGFSIRNGKENTPSRFFKNIDEKLLQEDQLFTKVLNQKDLDWYDSQHKINKEEMYVEQNYEFKIGDKIVHTYFGVGTILEVTKENIKVLFDNNKTKGVKLLDKRHKAIKRLIN